MHVHQAPRAPTVHGAGGTAYASGFCRRAAGPDHI